MSAATVEEQPVGLGQVAETPMFLTSAEAAVLLRLTADTVRRQSAAGQLPGVRRGASLALRAREIARLYPRRVEAGKRGTPCKAFGLRGQNSGKDLPRGERAPRRRKAQGWFEMSAA